MNILNKFVTLSNQLAPYKLIKTLSTNIANLDYLDIVCEYTQKIPLNSCKI